MRTFISLTLLATLIGSITQVQGEDGLFSEVAMESVFEKNAPFDNQRCVAGGRRKARADHRSFVTIVGFEIRWVFAKTRGKHRHDPVEQAGWKLPASLEVELSKIESSAKCR